MSEEERESLRGHMQRLTGGQLASLDLLATQADVAGIAKVRAGTVEAGPRIRSECVLDRILSDLLHTVSAVFQGSGRPRYDSRLHRDLLRSQQDSRHLLNDAVLVGLPHANEALEIQIIFVSVTVWLMTSVVVSVPSCLWHIRGSVA